MYSVRQLAELAGVTVRTLHYYDEIDLLKPTRDMHNGYRKYDEDALLRLQQILFYREMGLELAEIKQILDDPDFDTLTALRAHRGALQEKIERLQRLVSTVDSTIMHLTGAIDMPKKRLFEAFSEEQQKGYEREMRLQYGPETVNESVRRWGSCSAEQKEQIRAEGDRIYADLVQAIRAGVSARSAGVQAIMARWHQHLRYFYEPTLEILEGLGMMYNSHPDFIATFQRLHPDLPAYIAEAVAQYTDDLASAEIERMLAEDEARQARE